MISRQNCSGKNGNVFRGNRARNRSERKICKRNTKKWNFSRLRRASIKILIYFIFRKVPPEGLQILLGPKKLEVPVPVRAKPLKKTTDPRHRFWSISNVAVTPPHWFGRIGSGRGGGGVTGCIIIPDILGEIVLNWIKLAFCTGNLGCVQSSAPVFRRSCLDFLILETQLIHFWDAVGGCGSADLGGHRSQWIQTFHTKGFSQENPTKIYSHDYRSVLYKSHKYRK